MRLGETGVQLHRIGILDGGFAVLPLVEIAVPTLQKFLFTHVGITRAPREQRSDEEPNEKEANDYRTAHVFSKAGATAYVITNFWTLHQGTRIPVLNKVTGVIRGGTPTLSPRQEKVKARAAVRAPKESLLQSMAGRSRVRASGGVVALQFAVEGGATDAEHASSQGFVAFDLFEDALNGGAFDVFEVGGGERS